jgi:hypothetical protein
MGEMCIDRQEKIIIMLQTKMNGLTYNEFSKGLGEVRFFVGFGGGFGSVIEADCVF